MSFKVFAMDTFFSHGLGTYAFDAGCEILKELGYDGTYLTLYGEIGWENLSKLPSVKERYGLEVARVWSILDVAGKKDNEGNRRVLEMLETLEGCDTVELAMMSSDASLQSSDPKGDEPAVQQLQELLEVAESRGLTLCLYPHVFFWLERLDDALRLCRKVDHPNLGLVFCGYHWYAVDGKNLEGGLEQAAPFLKSANLCGCTMRDNPAPGTPPATVELLHEGALDNFYLLAMLKRVGYDGMVGLQGAHIGGDVYSKLERSLRTFRSMARRVEEHPHWGDLCPPAYGAR